MTPRVIRGVDVDVDALPAELAMAYAHARSVPCFMAVTRHAADAVPLRAAAAVSLCGAAIWNVAATSSSYLGVGGWR